MGRPMVDEGSQIGRYLGIGILGGSLKVALNVKVFNPACKDLSVARCEAAVNGGFCSCTDEGDIDVLFKTLASTQQLDSARLDFPPRPKNRRHQPTGEKNARSSLILPSLLSVKRLMPSNVTSWPSLVIPRPCHLATASLPMT